MKVLFISQYFYPENFRGNDVVFELIKHGHDVHVICGTPNYPSGSFYKGYGWFRKSSESLRGARVTRLPIIPRKKNSFFLVLNYLSYLINASIYVLFLSILKKYDCVFVQQLSPVTMSFPGVLYKRIKKVPLYTWVLDLWPESLIAAGNINNKLIIRFFAYFVKLEYKYSDRILISSKSFKKSIIKYGDYSNKTIFFPQWAEDEIAFPSSTKKAPILPSGFRIVFAGAVGESQDFEHIMEACKLTKNKPNIKWIIIGDGRKFEWVSNFVKKNKLEGTVTLTGRYPIEFMPSFFSQSDIMLVTLKDTEIFRLTAPAKIQAYMSMGKPILTMLNGEGRDIIEEANCGYSVSAESPDELSKMVIDLSNTNKEVLRIKGLNGLEYYRKNFEKNECINNLISILEHNDFHGYE